MRDKKVRTKIHVNQHIIKSNRKKDLEEPVFTVKQGSGRPTRYAKKVIIDGPSQLVYNPKKPLSCGAHVWIETSSTVYLMGEKSFADLKR
tara:strand:+ start:107 stop:376 length:270 start_codon:yes stop_codon:yes gene_type:complete